MKRAFIAGLISSTALYGVTANAHDLASVEDAISSRAELQSAIIETRPLILAQNTQGSLQGPGGRGGSGSGGGGASCPFPVDGGCALSPGGTFKIANFAAHAQQSGQTWVCNSTCLAAGGTVAHPWPSNKCGIDYNCGHYTATALLIDVASTAGLNALSAQGCTLNPTGSTSGGPFINCNQNTVDLRHLNFFSTLDNACVPMNIMSGTVHLHLEDDNWSTGGTANNNCHSENFLGNGSMFVWVTNPGTTDITYLSNTMDGGGQYTPVNGGVGLQQCMAFDTTAVTSLTIKYSVSLNCDNQPFIVNNNVDRTELDNYFENMVFLCTTGCLHAEDVEQSTVSVARAANFDIEGNTFLQGSGQAPCGMTAPWAPLDLRGGTATNGQLKMDDDVAIINIASVAQSCQGGPNSKIISINVIYAQTPYTGTISITGQYYDLESSAGDPELPLVPFSIKPGTNNACSSPATFGTNFDITTGNPHNAWDASAGTSGC